jgi:hypothetical protein
MIEQSVVFYLPKFVLLMIGIQYHDGIRRLYEVGNFELDFELENEVLNESVITGSCNYLLFWLWRS